jgi:hypothetical protein
LPQNSDSIDSSTKFAARDIREAMQSIKPMLGRVALDALIEDLKNLGLHIDNDRKSYTLREIQTALEKTFGEATILFVDRIRNALLERSK